MNRVATNAVTRLTNSHGERLRAEYQTGANRSSPLRNPAMASAS
jgi:hypothetical protein